MTNIDIRNTGKLRREVDETGKFLDFLEQTGRIQKIDKYRKDPNCIHVLEDFEAIAPENNHETLSHLHKINKDYKEFRKHALICERCQLSLDALFLFKGYENAHLFPKKIRKILEREWEYDKDKGIYVGKLPAPAQNFGSHSRLVYLTRLPIQAGIADFERRIRRPLNLQGLSEFHIRKKQTPSGRDYWQADTHHRNETFQTYISIRSKSRDI